MSETWPPASTTEPPATLLQVPRQDQMIGLLVFHYSALIEEISCEKSSAKRQGCCFRKDLTQSHFVLSKSYPLRKSANTTLYSCPT